MDLNSLIAFVQEHASIFGAIGVVISAVSLAFTVFSFIHKRITRLLKERVESLETECAKTKSERDDISAIHGKTVAQLESATSHAANLEQQVSVSQATIADLSNELEAKQEILAGKDRSEQKRSNLLKKVFKLEGRIWQRRPLHSVPKFKPLHERHVPIISVLNLKGGVGKTTITAYLSSALSAKGYKVLLVNLDLQGSLSSMFIHETILKQRSDEKHLLQHLLTAVAEKRKTDITDFCLPILGGKSSILPTTDKLAYSELNLTMQWLLRTGKRDNRFLLSAFSIKSV